MKKLEVLKVDVEIIKAKLFIFLAVASGSWVYAYKSQSMFSLVLWVVFTINAYGIFTNLTKLGDLQNNLKGVR